MVADPRPGPQRAGASIHPSILCMHYLPAETLAGYALVRLCCNPGQTEWLGYGPGQAVLRVEAIAAGGRNPLSIYTRIMYTLYLD